MRIIYHIYLIMSNNYTIKSAGEVNKESAFSLFMLTVLNKCLTICADCGMLCVVRGDTMTIEQKINMAAAYKGISQAELARQIGTTPSNLNLKVKRETLKMGELESIAAVLGGTFRFGFVFPDGTEI